MPPIEDSKKTCSSNTPRHVSEATESEKEK